MSLDEILQNNALLIEDVANAKAEEEMLIYIKSLVITDADKSLHVQWEEYKKQNGISINV